MRKILFLDIDGVLAVPSVLKYGMWGLCDARQALLGKILDATGCEIVLSSSWRLHTLEDTREYMTKEGFLFSERITGVTIRAYHYLDRSQKIHLSIPRGVEIKQWLDTHVHSENGKNYAYTAIGTDFQFAILDDDSDMLLEHRRHFVKCRWNEGLTERKAERVIRILNS